MATPAPPWPWRRSSRRVPYESLSGLVVARGVDGVVEGVVVEGVVDGVGMSLRGRVSTCPFVGPEAEARLAPRSAARRKTRTRFADMFW
ncbi:MAG TPA: hypothetical protein VEH77_16565 [Roseiarcus sp.]|nr:hypothetical protein [Roseiarcus sp.]